MYEMYEFTVSYFEDGRVIFGVTFGKVKISHNFVHSNANYTDFCGTQFHLTCWLKPYIVSGYNVFYKILL